MRPLSTGTVLDRIVAAKAAAVARQREALPLPAARAAAESAASPLDFAGALKRPGVSLIAEMKRASPSGGELRPDLDPAGMAATCAAAGAAALSVLTEADFFGGSLDDLRAAKRAAAPRRVPVLQKDFVFDEYQVYEARAHGADAILLIVAILAPQQVSDLLSLATSLGMAALVESFDESELETALSSNAELIGINNRNLKTLRTSLRVFERLAPLVPEGRVLVAESGMKGPADVQRMADAGADAVLVGESLMRAGAGAAELARRMTGGEE